MKVREDHATPEVHQPRSTSRSLASGARVPSAGGKSATETKEQTPAVAASLASASTTDRAARGEGAVPSEGDAEGQTSLAEG